MPTATSVRPLRWLVAALPLSLAACGGGSDPAPGTLTATVFPASGPLGTTQNIVVTFGATMNTASLSLGGSLSGANMRPRWNQKAAPNDQLVLAPAAPWATGTQTVTVSATAASGQTLATPLQVTYTVVSASSCGPSGGACNNAADCGFTIIQLATVTQTCFLSSGGSEANTATCVAREGVSAGCAGCTAAMAVCGVTNCLGPCGLDPASAECQGCVANACGGTFFSCAGRTL